MSPPISFLPSLPATTGQLTQKSILSATGPYWSLKMKLNAQNHPSYVISSLEDLRDVTSLL